MDQPLSIFMGSAAAEQIRSAGWKRAPFRTLVGASGGPKWLILSELDQVLAADLLADVPQLTLLGSSIGTWRHACLSQPNAVAAIQRLQKSYLYQEYSVARPTPQEVSGVAEQMLREALGARGIEHLVDHPRWHNAIVTARAKRTVRGRDGLSLIAGMSGATLANAVNRSGLATFFQRVVFCQRMLKAPPFADGFNTETVPLTHDNVIPALKASGAIPFLMECEERIPGAGDGPFWDGGIIDYHFSLRGKQPQGLVLYPHFNATLTPGWFDKMLRWRRAYVPKMDNLVLLCPSDSFLAGLPRGKIPDRGDFRSMKPDERVAYWEICVRESQRLAEAFHTLIHGDDPLKHVTLI
ncbi:MAG: patatin-like phospholipase family protein [Luminiphilus sp.]|jgi:hypothetical protein|nr:patatin-like phospholipase family protein [Luminiphilus sp.]